ncbi:DUF3236 domain-containing protein [Methanobacterium alkalithermotolerans]|uniref:DUF3236 domain-containing protein n=1 Tax=Methanobacterium alkalithermotolerans TaxID=2731220 RepID=A0A8T8K898_9EURY|nr:DUF3236 domain-containing protein [Methanobacterium alkalithermotolerans]QUH23150.1 DUF3236 domain-containing protein [Methanobacterium alkalithermotolerans]
MQLENLIKNAYQESADGIRKGDLIKEVVGIREYILNSKKIIVPNWNKAKLDVINQVLKEFGLRKAKHLEFHTSSCDLTRMPAINKAIMALDIAPCDLVIARGRLGVPGSGSMLVIIDNKGRLLSAAISPPHIIHGKTIKDAVYYEMTLALERLGFTRK